jgi:two-component system response regulator NreC
MSSKNRIRILVADDHSVVRKGLVSLLSLSPQFHVVAEAENGIQAFNLALQYNVDIVLMDISMPEMSGLEATVKIKSVNPAIKVLVLSAFDNQDYVLPVLRSGANGYLLKDGDTDEIEHAIISVAEGKAFFSPKISQIVLEDYLQQIQREQHQQQDSENYNGPLSKREIEVLKFIAESKTHHEIAQLLFLSTRTVDTHVNNIMKKLNLHDTAALVTYAVKHGFIVIK